MADRPKGDQFRPNPEIAPTLEIVDVLRGTISEPVKTISNKPGQVGQEVEVRLALDGPGMFGLTDWRDSREWSGIFNHTVLSVRYADHFAQGLESRGVAVDRQALMDAMIVSHPGRRQWDEAGWYPEAVSALVGLEARWLRANETNEAVGLRLIKGKVPDKVFNLVAALAHGQHHFEVPGEVYDSLEYKLAIYADHRTSQKFEPLNIRMGDFLLNNFYGEEAITDDLRKRVYSDIGYIIRSARICAYDDLLSYSVDVADDIMAQAGASESSSRLLRRELMQLVIQDAETEAMLIKAGVDVDNINDETVPMLKWEDDLRKQYVEAAGESIRARENEIMGLFSPMAFSLTASWAQRRLDNDFPENTWWGQYVRKLLQSSV